MSFDKYKKDVVSVMRSEEYFNESIDQVNNDMLYQFYQNRIPVEDAASDCMIESFVVSKFMNINSHNSKNFL